MRYAGSYIQWTYGKVILLFAAALLLPSCTTTTVTPEYVNGPSRNYDKVIIGDISVADELWETRIPYLRRGLVAALRDDGEFSEVLDSVPESVPEGAIVVSGQVTEVDKGDKALRFLIGFGAGRAKAAGLFSIGDAQGATLARFESRKAYSGGAGIGGFDMLDTDELMGKLGEETGHAISRWARGEPLEPPEKN